MGNIMSCIPWSRGVSICSPDVSIRSPDVSICSPDVPICSPDVPICSPDVPICSPDVSIRSPDVSIRSPDVSIPKPIHWSDLSEIDGDEEISRSLCHWSEYWSESDRDDSDTEAVTADNREVFKELQMHPQWGTFFKTFSEDDLVLGSKLAEGGQAELIDVQVDWRNPADRGKRSIIEERIERSKDHWTQMAQPNSSGSISDEEEAVEVNPEEAAAVEVSNRKVFEDLQKQSTFFYKFEKGEMVLGEKFAEGTQGEIYSAQIEWRNSDWRKLLLREGEGGDVLKDPSEYVIKAFKMEYKLEDLKNLFPKAMLEFHAERVHVWMERRSTCDVVCGTLLEDGRFAFVLQREQADLRTLIDRNMNSGKRGGPFPKDVAENFMYETALGMKWLHDHRIVHRDLKAANVLVRLHPDWNYCFVADYECSVGVIGTKFWRAPEILQSLKDRRPHSEKEKFFTQQADVYSYGMTCFEILTGKSPFEDKCANDYDLVLQGRRPVVPTYVDGWVKDLLSKCWEFKPEDRYSFEQILHTLEENSRAVKIHIGMTKNIPHSKLSEWDPPKTEVIPLAELARIYSAKQKQRQTQHPSEGIAQVHSHGQFDELYEPRNQLQSDWVIKVFKKGSPLRQLEYQWPQGLFHLHVDRRKRAMTGPTPEWKKPKYICDILCATLLKDGRFAFLLEKEQQDLRQLIERRSLHATVNKNLGPFPEEVAKNIMHQIALGMDWLHTYDIIHRDLQSSNVLVNEDEDGNYQCYVADFECSVGVVGTGFWRAPEILSAIKAKEVSKRLEVFSKAADVYAYGMTYYEVLTGKLPFENHPAWHYSIVLNGGRPELPSYVDGWVRELVQKCWEQNPTKRPSFAEILEIFDTAEENRMSKIDELSGEAQPSSSSAPGA